ncbi:hypothetical protein [[Ruminococcus] lactaris]|uniref:Uncharacterized protein n=1 Tax=[Ruminococcus] lactaris TaxID=46228 RepID=A0A414P1B6_9FIRM|nr:hypothetical protein [[Ruminococcus] lactaris]RHF57036.1 hypothetical protein DW672_12260 [[Ruminococcus] lactaris]
MNKKRLQRLGVVCMAAAMVLTTVSFPRVAKAEGDTSTQANEATSNELEKGKVLVQVKPSVLQGNAISNSQQNPAQGNDGLASWAFDEDAHWWHSRWTGTKDSSEDTISSTVRPWIGSGFGQEILLKKVTYKGRTDKASAPDANNSIRKYLLYYADMKGSTAAPDSSDWILVKSGHFTDSAEAQEIVLDQAVKATHFKLVGVNTNNWKNGDTEWTGSGSGSAGDGSTCAQNIKVYAEDTLNLTVTAPVDGQTLTDVKNEAVEETVATVKDTSENPIDTSAAIMNDDGTFGGQIANVDDSKLNALTGTKPFMIRMKVKLNSAATKDHILINRGGEPYQIAYGKDSTASRIKFQMRDTNGNWHETKVCVTDKIGQEIDILALYTGSTMGLWVNGERCNDYSSHYTSPNSSYTMKTGTANALKIGEADSNASIKSMQVVKDIGTISNTADYNTVVIPAFNQGNRLLDLRVVEGMTDHQYTLTSQWVNADGTQNYSAVVTATPKNSLKFTADSMPQTLKVNVDGTNIKDVSVTNSSVDENGVLTITYDFEKMFIGGSLRMDHGNTYDQTSMRYGYDFTLPDGATFVGCEWYYGTAENALVNTLQPKETKYITNPDSKGANVYRSNIVFTNLGSANYENNVYARVLVKYTLNGKSYSKMGSSIDTRTVKAVAESIRDSKDASEKQKIYANGILGTISK